MTTEEIAQAVHEVIRAHHNDRPEWGRATKQYRADLVEIVKFRLDNPDVPLSAHHCNYVSVLNARGESHHTPSFSDLTIKDVEEDVLAVRKILELRALWEGNVQNAEPVRLMPKGGAF